jgi:hypothetical protein
MAGEYNCHVHSIEYQLCSEIVCHGPADYSPGVGVRDEREGKLALPGPYIRDVCYPPLFRTGPSGDMNIRGQFHLNHLPPDSAALRFRVRTGHRRSLRARQCVRGRAPTVARSITTLLPLLARWLPPRPRQRPRPQPRPRLRLRRPLRRGQRPSNRQGYPSKLRWGRNPEPGIRPLSTGPEDWPADGQSISMYPRMCTLAS